MTTLEEQQLARFTAALEVLKKRFPHEQISQLPASAGRPALDYVNHAHVTNRLNGSAPPWTYTIDHEFTHGGEFWIRGTMTIYGVSRVEYGKGRDPLNAVSHFIRRAAMRFGVATDLWAKEDLEGSEPVGYGEGPTGSEPDPGVRTAAGEGAQEALAAAAREAGGPERPASRASGRSCAHPAESRVTMAPSGRELKPPSFYCEACGLVVNPSIRKAVTA